MHAIATIVCFFIKKKIDLSDPKLSRKMCFRLPLDIQSKIFFGKLKAKCSVCIKCKIKMTCKTLLIRPSGILYRNIFLHLAFTSKILSSHAIVKKLIHVFFLRLYAVLFVRSNSAFKGVGLSCHSMFNARPALERLQATFYAMHVTVKTLIVNLLKCMLFYLYKFTCMVQWYL